jgi:hypothetical protein
MVYYRVTRYRTRKRDLSLFYTKLKLWKAKSGKAGQSGAKQGKAGQSRAKQGKAGQGNGKAKAKQR